MLSIRSRCWLCRQPLSLVRHGICSCCLRHLPVPPPCCPRCGLPAGETQMPCGRCLQRPPPWQRLVLVGDYVAPLSQLVKRFKFHRAPELAPTLARLMLLRWQQARREQYLNRPDLILAVPLHASRCWRRGYNQSDLLARPLARWLGCAYRPAALRRVR
ncbi:DNA utilization protein GntX, partial [Serratia marcescens]|uniref:double zinc ribbon domain-containing protein n=2 Tax=Serratia marcescens TaxID=615 RepID=UPI000F7D5EED